MDAAAPTADLSDLSLPELQQRYAEVVGEETKCPNKKYLVRRITEVLEDEAEELADGSAPQEVEADEPEGAEADEPTGDETAAGDDGEKLTKLDVAALRERYLEVVGRPTTSQHRGYLIWKIRQAQRGQIPVGPLARTASGPQKVIPLRLETDLVDRLDAVRRKRGMRSRMELFRRALSTYLTEIGEDALADALAVDEAPAGGPTA